MTVLQAFRARTGEPLGEALAASTPAEIDAAVQAAADAFVAWSASDGTMRAALLRAMADALLADREALVALADDETALGPVRLNGELDRTAFPVEALCRHGRAGRAFAVLDDPAVAGPPPGGHPAMARVRVPLGPVAMFAASNFPFAFSVCPVATPPRPWPLAVRWSSRPMPATR
jgi:acyl-CoA reductase-like NAD-dependent aldehyde dehydrogenase